MVASDIRESKELMMKANRKYKLCILLLACCLIYGCQTGKVITESKVEKEELSASQKIDYEYILTEATKQKLFGNFKQAVSLYEKCIQVNKSSDIAYYQIGNILLMTGNYDRALTYARKAVELNNTNYWFQIQLAQLYLIKNNRDSAKIIYEKIIDEWPEKVEIHYEIARIDAEEKEYDKSLKILNKIENENGISEPVSMLKEQIFVQMGKTDLAVNELQKLVNMMPEEIRYLGLLAELYNSAGRNEEARETYEMIFKIAPDNVMALLSYTEFLKEIGQTEEQYAILNKIFRDEKIAADQKLKVLIGYLTNEKEFNKENNKIGQLIKILLELYPDNYKVRTAHADYLVKNNKYSEALAEYNYVLSVEKNNYFIWEQVILIENTLGNNEEVYSRSSEAINIFKDKPILYLFKGNAAMSMGNTTEAVSVFEEGIKYTENNNTLKIQFYSLVAEAYRSMGDHEKSDNYYEEALKLDPENLLILNNYSYFLSLRQAKLKIAEKMSKKTIVAEPENYTYLDTYAWILFNSGNYKKALEYIEKAMQFNGSGDPDILEHYGDILEKLGRKKDAVKYWKLSVEKGNENEDIIRKIEAVKNYE
jgi:tetratricopeptide (TPR) repeat protein